MFSTQGVMRRRQRHPRLCYASTTTVSLSLSKAARAATTRLPVADRQVDRREGPGGGDRCGDDRSRRELAVDGEESAKPEHGGLQHHTQHARDRAECTADIVGPRLELRCSSLAVLKRLTARPAKPIALSTRRCGHSYRRCGSGRRRLAAWRCSSAGSTPPRGSPGS